MNNTNCMGLILVMTTCILAAAVVVSAPALIAGFTSFLAVLAVWLGVAMLEYRPERRL